MFTIIMQDCFWVGDQTSYDVGSSDNDAVHGASWDCFIGIRTCKVAIGLWVFGDRVDQTTTITVTSY